jgi:hypothetical protein
MSMNTTTRGKYLNSGKNILMFGDDGLEFRMHRGCLSGANGIELCKNVEMTFVEDIFHVMGTDDFRGVGGDALELILLSLLAKLHG